MAYWIASLAGLAIAYLLGATPTGYLAGKLLKGIDLRTIGSGSTGATNVLRTLGKGPALAVFLIDLVKGAAAVLTTRWLWAWLATAPFGAPPAGFTPQILTSWAVCLAGLAAVIGHSRSIWLNFTGGKSAAAGLGVLLAMSWPVGLGAAAVVIATLAAFRIMSLSSLLGAASAIALACALDEPLPYRLLVIAGGLYVTWLHRANIGRLLTGTEPRLGRFSPGSANPQT
ncbi:glycerol-3-phosphate 1-O-acyltransferase PlsY [Phenylobacterium aquaticum]|uniref:glycerol-3-phosphate 1-O-acyltransferase PlsY n=1 Tax=Phenylobacterium aquaticum TaxID=1763816 RepID=UPI001F5CF8EF|nr:glycerol-3-phosphate 1-O-acyltransferase PlsY [Phenylobacterium aquaticum]MCI3134971.1 glycerol-3-phosphate 1-O-acyltransferase PlsY [Phenylobacterium aquaticum]